MKFVVLKLKNVILGVFLCVGFVSSWAQSPTSAFKKLSSAEKCWVYFHVFKAQKAHRVSLEVSKTIDSIQITGSLGNHHVGNQLDAFKHAYWMWTLAEEIGCRAAKSLGKSHEKGSYQYYKKHELEDGVLPDEISSVMDSYNNKIGLELYKAHKGVSKTQRIKLVKEAVFSGKLRMIYQNLNREYLDKDGNILPEKNYKGLWKNDKILIPTKAFLFLPN